MVIKRESVEFNTTRRVEIQDITRKVGAVLDHSGIKNGLLNVYSPHSTSGVVVNEA